LHLAVVSGAAILLLPFALTLTLALALAPALTLTLTLTLTLALTLRPWPAVGLHARGDAVAGGFQGLLLLWRGFGQVDQVGHVGVHARLEELAVGAAATAAMGAAAAAAFAVTAAGSAAAPRSKGRRAAQGQCRYRPHHFAPL
jgi:hypothetical protein